MSTPMFRQYKELKAENPDAILFFRMGDFYEVFFDDAVLTARELELTLTTRNKKDPNPIPMAGVPYHAVNGYIQRMVDKGYRIAIANQVEDPKQAKGLVKRAVVRIVTPGVVLDPSTLNAVAPNYLIGVSEQKGRFGVAFLDLSTGEFRCTEVNTLAQVVSEICRMEPKEALFCPALTGSKPLLNALRRVGAVLSPLSKESWSPTNTGDALFERLGGRALEEAQLSLDGAESLAAGALLLYGEAVLSGALSNVSRIHRYAVESFMVIDGSTSRNLELFRTLIGARRKGSLLWLIDKTSTAMGSRMMREWLAFPLLQPSAIHQRSAAVQCFIHNLDRMEALRRALRAVSDIERVSARVAQNTAHARDLSALRSSLSALPEIFEAIDGLKALQSHRPSDPCSDVLADLKRWLSDDPPIGLTEAGLIQSGAHAELDRLTALSIDGVGVIERMEASERERTGISTLKIRRNRVFGYFIEITRAHLHRAPDHYLRKQTLTNAERYITPELKELEESVLSADERRKALEHQLFLDLRARVSAHTPRLLALARQLATLDVIASLAQIALDNHWTRPTISLDDELLIEAGRHPVVEATLTDERFVPNDLRLNTSDQRLIVLTGPNMSGKSTVMRQSALIVLLAQIGSFVPADSAQIGVVDRIFTRVGAADDLAHGQSTFMVEMSETASILSAATARSLVVLDEIGRGTSTYDGLAIAWAVAEDLVDRVGCRALFATHYHELCDLASARSGVVNQSVSVSESGDTVVFLRQLKPGRASRSYGVQCARIAGLPTHVVQRAQGLLTEFEAKAPRNEHDQLSLFSGGQPPHEAREKPRAVDLLREHLMGLDPDALNPRQAHQALYDLRDLL